jgi:hypothetical protein
VMATVPNGPALNVCGGAAVDSGAVIVGFGSGCGVVGAAAGAAAGACPDESAAGACAYARCPAVLRTAISMNVRRPPHCFCTIKLLSHLAFDEASSLRPGLYAAAEGKTNAIFR